MAWIRTATSLITFRFTVCQILSDRNLPLEQGGEFVHLVDLRKLTAAASW